MHNYCVAQCYNNRLLEQDIKVFIPPDLDLFYNAG